jgi:rhodanese-related sulfurtransferase
VNDQPTRFNPADIRHAWRNGHEIALLDVREEDDHAQAHPLFAAQLSLSRLELDAPWRLPRRGVPIAVMDAGQGLADIAIRRLQALGYTDVRMLEGGLEGWQAAGGELFRDVNSPSKAFGELVEHERGTPTLPAEAVQALQQEGADMVVLDARRYDEFRTMSIPGGTSVPGAELVLRARTLAPDPATLIIVNCAGRTRSLIGAQSLINAGIPNPVAALRNGTIGWLLAGQTLEHGQSSHFGPVDPGHLASAQKAAQRLAARAGATILDEAGLARWTADTDRTLYRWDVRTPAEYEAGHRPGFGSAPGGQLVQETDVYAAVRGARIVLCDGGPRSDGVRAPMTAHWLAQMGWEVAWMNSSFPEDAMERGAWRPESFSPPKSRTLSPEALATLMAAHGATLIDLSTCARYVQGHVPGAAWALRSQWRSVLAALPSPPDRIVLTADREELALFGAAELRSLVDVPIDVLEGGNAAWSASGRALAVGEERLLSPRIDRYRRPYEGTDAPHSAMQAYLDWEFGLVAQLARDGTHRFRVLPAE